MLATVSSAGESQESPAAGCDLCVELEEIWRRKAPQPANLHPRKGALEAEHVHLTSTEAIVAALSANFPANTRLPPRSANSACSMKRLVVSYCALPS
jgi:hypothetical protein